MQGGVTGFDAAEQLIVDICEVINLKKNAFNDIHKYLDDHAIDDSPLPKPPTYFKIGTLSSVDETDKIINIDVSIKIPVGNSGDGVAVNTKAARVLRDIYGLLTPDYRCAAHISSGTIKRLTTSKTMNVEEITVLYNALRTVILHFSSSIKNKEKLLTALQETSSHTKKLRSCDYEEVDKAVYQWFTLQRSQHIPIDCAMIKEKALFYAEKFKFPDFKASDGWLEKWKKR